MTNIAHHNNPVVSLIEQSSLLPDKYDAEALIADYLKNDNMESLCSLVLDIYARDLKKIIVSRLHPRTESELNEYLTDFCDFLLTPTVEGYRRLANYHTSQSFIKYLKSILRNWSIDLLVARSQKDCREQSVDDDEATTIANIAEDESSPYEEMTSALLKGIDGCAILNPRDRYILLTWLMVKSSNANATQIEVCAVLARQLDCSPESVRRALGRALSRLKDESMKNFNFSCPKHV